MPSGTARDCVHDPELPVPIKKRPMRLTRTALLVLAALLLGAPAGVAQTITSPIRYIDETQSIGGFVGYQWANPHLHVNDSTTLELGPQAAPVFGVQYRVRFSGPLSGRLGVAYSPTERNQFTMGVVEPDAAIVQPIDTGERVTANILMLDAGLHFGLTGPRAWRGIAPYVSVGTGLVVDLAGTSELEQTVPVNERFELGPSFALQAAIGTDFFLAERVSLRLELQNRLWRMAAPAGLAGRTTARGEWNSVPGVSVGAGVHF